MALLADDLDQTAAASLASRLAEVGQAAAALELLTELREGSRKVASVAVEALPEVAALLPGEAVVTWIDLTVSLNEQSGAASIKLDRKSTRLNSSHLVISYAVFCLKKKNDTTTTSEDLCLT